MKILQVNKFYYPRGGADKYFLNLIEAQKKVGHQVAVFSMHHPQNLSNSWSSYFVSRVSFNQTTLKDKIKTPGRVLYSLEAKRKFTKLIKNFQPDIIHIHNIYHQISPSILDVANKYKIPVVMHLHDYKLICANHSLFTAGAVCQRCQGNKYYQCLKNRCVKDSFSASLLATIEMYLHHSVLKIYEKKISAFIAPSQFMKDMLVDFGQETDKISVIYNPYDKNLAKSTSNHSPNGENDYILYFGRLSPEKGLETLIRASALSNQRTKIAGEGEKKHDLQQLAEKLQAPVEFVGLKHDLGLKRIIEQAKAIIIPSIWYENMPLSLMEAMSMGKIVIASRIGGIPEIIKSEKNGLLFASGSEQDLTRQIKHLSEINQKDMSQQAQKTSTKFTPEKNLEKIMDLYQKVIK